MSDACDWPAMAAFMGPRAYDRNAYAREPAGEAAFVVEQMGLPTGALVADVGAGTGRHLRYWREAGLRAVGFDLSIGFRPEVVADARRLPVRDKSVDAAVALGGIAGYVRLPALVAELERVARRVAVMATFSLEFARRRLGIASDVVDETVRLPDGQGRWAEFRHVHACHLPSQLPGTVYEVDSGDYGPYAPAGDRPELLAIWRVD